MWLNAIIASFRWTYKVRLYQDNTHRFAVIHLIKRRMIWAFERINHTSNIWGMFIFWNLLPYKFIAILYKGHKFAFIRNVKQRNKSIRFKDGQADPRPYTYVHSYLLAAWNATLIALFVLFTLCTARSLEFLSINTNNKCALFQRILIHMSDDCT